MAKKRAKIVKPDLDGDWEKMVAKWNTTPTFTRDTPPKGKVEPNKTKKITAKSIDAPLTGYLSGRGARDTEWAVKAKSLVTGGVGEGTRKAVPQYTGTKMLGVGTMHKSSAIPIFSEEQALEVATMRRN